MQKIIQRDFEEIVATKSFNNLLLEKDYFVTAVLFLLKDISHIYFKGGTALNKIFLNYARLSEDIDLTVTGDLTVAKDKIEKALSESLLFTSITFDKRVDRFTRIVANYNSFYGNPGSVFIDLSRKSALFLNPEKHNISHYYEPHIPSFSFITLAQQEMLAEKMRATIERNKPRDHFDLYQIITSRLPLDLQLVQQKCAESGSELDITKMFNRANRLKHRWDEDLGPLLSKKITFQEVMSTLAQHFKLKEEKEKKKKIHGDLVEVDADKGVARKIDK